VRNAPRHVLAILAVDDLQPAKRFHAEAVAWPLQADVPAYAEVALPAATRLGLYERVPLGRNAGDDLSSAIEAGARELGPRGARPRGDGVVHFADPDGNAVLPDRALPSTCGAEATER
jgi:hypothetical protein